MESRRDCGDVFLHSAVMNSPQGAVAGHTFFGGGPLQLPLPVLQITLPGLPDPAGTPHIVAQSVGA